MSKLQINRRQREEYRNRQEVDALLELDLDPSCGLNDKDKAKILAQKLVWLVRPPNHETLATWRKKDLYSDRRDHLLDNTSLKQRVQYWAARLFEELVIPGYRVILTDAKKGRIWLDVADRVQKMAGIVETPHAGGLAASEFLQQLGVQVVTEAVRKTMTVNREEDGMLETHPPKAEEGEFREVVNTAILTSPAETSA